MPDQRQKSSIDILTYVYSRFHLNWLNVILLKFFINMFYALKLGYHFRLIDFQSKHIQSIEHVIETRTTYDQLSQKLFQISSFLWMNLESEFPKCSQDERVSYLPCKAQMILWFVFYDRSIFLLLSSTISYTVTMYIQCIDCQYGENYSYFHKQNTTQNLIDHCPFIFYYIFWF